VRLSSHSHLGWRGHGDERKARGQPHTDRARHRRLCERVLLYVPRSDEFRTAGSIGISGLPTILDLCQPSSEACIRLMEGVSSSQSTSPILQARQPGIARHQCIRSDSAALSSSELSLEKEIPVTYLRTDDR